MFLAHEFWPWTGARNKIGAQVSIMAITTGGSISVNESPSADDWFFKVRSSCTYFIWLAPTQGFCFPGKCWATHMESELAGGGLASIALAKATVDPFNNRWLSACPSQKLNTAATT